MQPLTRVVAVLAAALSSSAAAFQFGVNTRHDPALNAEVAELMRQRNFTSARMDLIWDRDVSALRDQATRIRAHAGNVQVVLQTSYQWDERCNQDRVLVEQEAYRQAAGAIHKVKDVVHDFELLNEPQHRRDIRAEVSWNSARTSTASYEGKPCLATLAAALRGMSRALSDIREQSGLPLRSILGVVGRDFGYLSFMRKQGVRWDVTGYHIYPHASQPSLLNDPWYGPGGPLAQLASFGKPVHINEFNCGEIYDAEYENQAGGRSTETCLRGLARHLGELRSQNVANIEAVHLYMLHDEPHKEPPENRFGLTHDVRRPKLHLAVVASFTGGALSEQEREELARRGLLVQAGPRGGDKSPVKVGGSSRSR